MRGGRRGAFPTAARGPSRLTPMFDVGFSELMLIAVVVAIIIPVLVWRSLRSRHVEDEEE